MDVLCLFLLSSLFILLKRLFILPIQLLAYYFEKVTYLNIRVLKLYVLYHQVSRRVLKCRALGKGYKLSIPSHSHHSSELLIHHKTLSIYLGTSSSKLGELMGYQQTVQARGKYLTPSNNNTPDCCLVWFNEIISQVAELSSKDKASYNLYCIIIIIPEQWHHNKA